MRYLQKAIGPAQRRDCPDLLLIGKFVQPLPMSSATLSLLISILSLGFAGWSLWWSALRRGRLRMTRPSVVFFGHDGGTPKVFIRSLLYSTSARGQLIEHMYARVTCGETAPLFTFWGYGESNALSAGSGLFVSQNGIALNHHFVMSVHAEAYTFEPGKYAVEIFAKVLPHRRSISLGKTEIELTAEQTVDLRERRGILFERDPVADSFKGEAGPDPTNKLAVAADRAIIEAHLSRLARLPQDT